MSRMNATIKSLEKREETGSISPWRFCCAPLMEWTTAIDFIE